MRKISSKISSLKAAQSKKNFEELSFRCREENEIQFGKKIIETVHKRLSWSDCVNIKSLKIDRSFYINLNA